MTDPIETMSGEAVLSMVRDAVANEAARLTIIEEAVTRLFGIGGMDAERIQFVRVLGAAADVLTLLIATGQYAKIGKRNDHLLFVKQCADQARAALMATDKNKESGDDKTAA